MGNKNPLNLTKKLMIVGFCYFFQLIGYIIIKSMGKIKLFMFEQFSFSKGNFKFFRYFLSKFLATPIKRVSRNNPIAIKNTQIRCSVPKIYEGSAIIYRIIELLAPWNDTCQTKFPNNFVRSS
ncbi:MAG: hypothetical protein BWZ03_00567 [bacterium ADurb.BinA186]|nr:MAG: hypothetical protein BWZ03_00567 [bacterium ADurb.BinA186]